MAEVVSKFIAGCVFLVGIASGADRIDRHALVTRHNIEWNESTGQIPLGNGEFCFNADGTGLQTFGGNSMSHWGWHSFPLPEGVKPEMVPATGTMSQRRVKGEDSVGISDQLWGWMFDNPHIMNLGRIRLRRTNGVELAPAEITGLTRTLDLWSGAGTSVYRIDGEPVRVETRVHPSQDAVAVRIESPLIARGVLQVALDFPYPTSSNHAWVGDFKRADGHQTTMTRHGERRADFRRVADAATYSASLEWSKGATLTVANDSHHRFVLAAKNMDRLQFVCAFAQGMLPGELSGTDKAFADAASHWKSFWSTGGAIDLSESKVPRWKELERRIVLSQYLMAAQSAGSWPSAETGLMGLDPWRSQFHMEMIWWHLAHYGLWDRWNMADEALGCYKKFAPVARQLATQLGYKGLKWPKSVGPAGRSAPWGGNQVLLWKQPHPIFFAELEYRLRPTLATLEKWADIIDGTTENMADYPTKDENTGIYSLKPVMLGNGGLLYAVAMMAAGWDGAPSQHAPGFPADGSWVVKWEELKTAP